MCAGTLWRTLLKIAVSFLRNFDLAFEMVALNMHVRNMWVTDRPFLDLMLRSIA